jgi:hypothetical protein
MKMLEEPLSSRLFAAAAQGQRDRFNIKFAD